MSRFLSASGMEPRGTFLFDAHLDPNHATLGDSVAVDLRYLEPIVDGIRDTVILLYPWLEYLKYGFLPGRNKLGFPATPCATTRGNSQPWP